MTPSETTVQKYIFLRDYSLLLELAVLKSYWMFLIYVLVNM